MNDEAIPKILLVDGHSLIFSTPEFREAHAVRPEYGRQRLVNVLSGFQDMSVYRVVIVFDGSRQRTETSVEESLPKGAQVVYAKAGSTADDVIERLVRKYNGSYDITVVTRDRAEIDIITAEGAYAMSPTFFWDLYRMEEERFRSQYG